MPYGVTIYSSHVFLSTILSYLGVCLILTREAINFLLLCLSVLRARLFSNYLLYRFFKDSDGLYGGL